ncbi:MBL fold metallo-hydrolase [Sneathiella sp.]|jgi:glyoxylase-like metal-dependent hydrolase (beta-lactamase superfamily II)|uniref:MBL fold metallo-hydrolase n=1 Tax=Sneathiella sp. TaxID=1964365 RepID=UPI0039E68C0C
MNVWQIGDIKISRIVEIETSGGTRFILPDATPENVLPITWLAPHFMTEDGKLTMSIHALVVDTGTTRIIVDTCIGNDKERVVPSWNKLQTRFLEDLELAGYPRDSIDMVLCTHLHVDHVGWNTMLEGDRWVPTFPNAEYLFGRREWEHWQQEDQDHYGSVIEDSVEPIIAAGLARFVDMDEQICEGVALVPTPGHTPGHVSVQITSKGQEAWITGDSIHHPCQMARTDWSSAADTDPEEARSTRLAMLKALSERDVLVIGTHFATPTAGHVKADGEDRFRFDV